jgi:hypothetical protein
MSPDQPCVDPTNQQTLCGLVLHSIVLRKDGVRFKDLLVGFVAHLLKMLPMQVRKSLITHTRVAPQFFYTPKLPVRVVSAHSLHRSAGAGG